MNYKSYMLHNFRTIPQIQNLSEDLIEAIEIVGSVLPFKTNNYVVENLIDWTKVPNDPIFTLTFPRKKMLRPHHFEKIKVGFKILDSFNSCMHCEEKDEKIFNLLK